MAEMKWPAGGFQAHFDGCFIFLTARNSLYIYASSTGLFADCLAAMGGLQGDRVTQNLPPKAQPFCFLGSTNNEPSVAV